MRHDKQRLKRTFKDAHALMKAELKYPKEGKPF